MKTRADIRALLAALGILVPAAVFAGFGSTDTFLPAVGRVPGQDGAQFYTTVWATNLTTAPQNLTFEFLKQGQANASPAKFTDTLAPGETKVYENVVESKLGLNNALGAARVTSTGEIFVSERIYNQAPGADLGDTEGLFFAGVPKGFSISAGQSASIQGINQGGAENFRYNFALIETGGGNPTVNVQVFDGTGTMLGQKSYALLPYEQIQPNVADVVAGVATTNARITATVTGGSGSVLLAGAQLANESQDSSGFEMTFRDSLLGGGTAGVTSLNGLTGALTLTAGSGISITPSGSSIAIAYSGGGSSGLTSVTHDASLSGSGTGASPLAVANGQVVRSVNGLHDNLTLTAGSNVTITPSGSTLTIAASGGGLTLPFSGSMNGGATGFHVTNFGNGIAIEGDGSSGDGVYGASSSAYGVSGVSLSGIGVEGQSNSSYAVAGYGAGPAGVFGTSTAGDGVLGQVNSGGHAGVSGTNTGAGYGVYATSASSDGVHGLVNNSASGVAGLNNGSGPGIYGSSIGGYGVFGTGSGGWGVYGSIAGGFGATAGVNSGNGPGIYAESSSGSGIYATSSSGYAGYFAGDLTYTGTLTHSSDARFKENVAPLENALDGVLRLRGVTFDWRRVEFPEHHFPTGRSIGFIAQEIESAFPSLVSTDADGYRGVDYAGLTPVLVEAIKEQEGRIEAQQGQIERQQRQIDELVRRLERLSSTER